jgi:hypothetical protein
MLKSAVEKLNRELDVQTKRLLRGVNRRPDRIESAIGLSAHWSASSFGDAPPLRSLSAPVPAREEVEMSSLQCSNSQSGIVVGG